MLIGTLRAIVNKSFQESFEITLIKNMKNHRKIKENVRDTNFFYKIFLQTANMMNNY